MKTTLHHFAYTITPDSLELVLGLMENLGCTLSYRKGRARWCIIEQKPIPTLIQLIEVKDKPMPIDKKINTHIAFLSKDPKKDIEEIERWARSKSVRFRKGRWSDKMLWFDLPDLFVNFVVEIMHSSIAE